MTQSRKKMRVVYLSGPMRNQPNENLELFNARTRQLEDAGFIVYNPHVLSRDLERSLGVPESSLPFTRYLRNDYGYIAQSDLVAVLPGWEKSVGALKEVRVARDLNIPVHEVQLLLDGNADLLPSVELPESALQEAQRLVHGDRISTYGHPIDDYTRTGRMWGAILGIPDIDPRICTLMMAAVKISRETNAPKRDNRVDGAGYFECADMIAERQGK